MNTDKIYAEKPATFGNAEEQFTLVMEASSGAGFFVVIILLGVYLLTASSNGNKRDNVE